MGTIVLAPRPHGAWKHTQLYVSLQANELIWMTDRTPHESMPLKGDQPRQFFRLVTRGIDTWFAAHSTMNPLGVQPEATIVNYDKFTGKASPVLGSCEQHG